MAQALALPRIKTKKKKRKPPGPGFWSAAFWLSYAIFCLTFSTGYAVYHVLNTQPLWTVFQLGFACWWWWDIIHHSWPRFKREWDAWRRDEEE